MNHAIKLNVSKLPQAFRATITGKTTSKECLCIPIENLFEGDKGLYLNLTAIELREAKYGQTHMVKIQVDGEEFKAMTDEQKSARPILGSMQPLERKAVASEQAPAVTAQFGGDLPF